MIDELQALQPGDAIFISCSTPGCSGVAGKCAYCGELWSECDCLCNWMDCACGERKEDIAVQEAVRSAKE